MKKFLVLLIISVLSAGCMSGCSSSADEANVKTEDITLDIDGDYEIYADMSELEACMALECDSTDESVAVVRNGNHICALRTGTATITVKNQDETTKYNVTVNPGNAGARSIGASSAGISEKELYIGYGFDVSSGAELDASTMSKTPLFDWDKICDSDETLMMDFDVKNSVSAYAENSMYDLVSKYSEKADVSISVKVFGLARFEKSLVNKYKNSVKTESSVTGIYNNLSINYQRASVWLSEDRTKGGYSAFLTDQAAEDLYGEECLSARVFIEKYGTHVLVSGIYGQKMDCNYVITDEPTSPTNTPSSEFLKLLNSSDFSYKDVSGDDIDFYNNLILRCTFNAGTAEEAMANQGIIICENDVEKHRGYVCTDKTLSYKAIGRMEYFERHQKAVKGDYYESGGLCIPEFTNDYRWWQKYMDEYYEENPDDIGTLIGPRNDHSLVPVWELIPKSSGKYYDRTDEFINYLWDITS